MPNGGLDGCAWKKKSVSHVLFLPSRGPGAHGQPESGLACGAQGKRTASLLRLGIVCVATQETRNRFLPGSKDIVNVRGKRSRTHGTIIRHQTKRKVWDTRSHMANGRPGQQTLAEEPPCTQLWGERPDATPARPHRSGRRAVMRGRGLGPAPQAPEKPRGLWQATLFLQ